MQVDRRWRVAAVLWLALWPRLLRAADDRAKSATARRAQGRPQIDGRLDDAAWRGVPADDRFTQNFPDEGAPPSQRTEVFLIYDDRALYVGVRCHDREPERIVEWLTRRDRDTVADKVSVDIDSRHDHNSAYHFEVNVSGVLADGLRFNDTEVNSDWDGLWSAATSRDRGGWTAEIEIPWRTLRFDGKAPVMGLQIRRALPRRQEVDEWAYIPRRERGEVSRYGSLVGVSGLGPKRLMQLSPYLAGGILLRANSTAPSDNGTFFSPNAGLDAKLGLTSSLTLDATVNPDFGQVEADQVVLNLTTFEVFYPEKRPFFLEGVELFATPVQQFYTRRIGRSPSVFNAAASPDGSASEATVETPLSGRIWGAIKLSGQVVPHLSIAAIDAVTAEQTATVALTTSAPAAPSFRGPSPLPPGWRPIQQVSAAERRLLDPLSNFAVLRLRGEWGSSYVGAQLTAVNRFEADDAAAAPRPWSYCPGDDNYLAGSGRCSHDAYTAGLDARLLSNGGTWSLAAQAVGSLVDHGRSRILRDGTVIGSGDLGFGLRVQGAKQGGEPLRFGVRYEGYTPKLELNDAGYLRSANQHYLGLRASLITTRPRGRTLEAELEVFQWNRWAWDGALIEQGVGSGPFLRFRNFWQMWFGGGYSFDRWDNRETHDGALTRRRGGFWVEAWLKSDPRRALTGEANLHLHRVQHGYSATGDLTLGLRALPQLEVQVIPRVNYTYGDPRFAYVPTDGSRYWFGDLESQSFDVTVRGTYTFTPRLSFQVYAQVFVAGAHYSRWIASSPASAVACPDPAFSCPRTAVRLPFESFAAAAPPPGDPPWAATQFDLQSGQINVNALLRWEYRPGSTLLAVYTRSQSQPDYDYASGVVGGPSFSRFRGGPTVDNVLVKLSYLWR